MQSSVHGRGAATVRRRVRPTCFLRGPRLAPRLLAVALILCINELDPREADHAQNAAQIRFLLIEIMKGCARGIRAAARRKNVNPFARRNERGPRPAR
jgi:hypothetical protein